MKTKQESTLLLLRQNTSNTSDTYSLVTQESTLLLLGESAPNLVILKFDALSPSRKRVLSYKSAVTGKRVLSYTSAVTGKRVLSSYIGRVVLIET